MKIESGSFFPSKEEIRLYFPPVGDFIPGSSPYAGWSCDRKSDADFQIGKWPTSDYIGFEVSICTYLLAKNLGNRDMEKKKALTLVRRPQRSNPKSMLFTLPMPTSCGKIHQILLKSIPKSLSYRIGTHTLVEIDFIGCMDLKYDIELISLPVLIICVLATEFGYMWF